MRMLTYAYADVCSLLTVAGFARAGIIDSRLMQARLSLSSRMLTYALG